MSGADLQEPTGWPEDARRDRLIGDWHIYQRVGGHRTSTDDLITAWYAVHRTGRKPARYLDLGCGVGSVLLMVAHKLRPRLAHGIEGQAQSVEMARRAIAELPANDCDLRVEHADFRAIASHTASYDLVTGSPPYFPLHAGTLPNDAQRRACRFEARGGVEAYMAAAALAMSADARFYIVFQTMGTDRVLAAATAQQLYVTGTAEFHMRTDREAPFLTVFELGRNPEPTPHRFQCAVRDGSGSITPEYLELRQELGVA